MFNFIKDLFKPKADLSKLVQEGALIVDVRTKAEFQSGHIAGSRNIPLDDIKKEAVALKNLNRPIITICKSGARSGMAKSILVAAGINVQNGGAWTSLQHQLKNQ